MSNSSSNSKDFWYLATPYSKYPQGLEAAFIMASKAVGTMLKSGVPCYSPIAHTHPVAMYSELDPLDHKIWMPFDEAMMDHAKGLIVLMAPTWEQSYGISLEIEHFRAQEKPIRYLEPEVLSACDDLSQSIALDFKDLTW